MNQPDKITKPVRWFAKAALRHAEALKAFDAEAASELVRELDRFYGVVKRERGLESFLTLLDDQDPVIAGMAAVYAIREATERCTATLGKLASQPGMIGFRAEAALERWESGDWPS